MAFFEFVFFQKWWRQYLPLIVKRYTTLKTIFGLVVAVFLYKKLRALNNSKHSNEKTHYLLGKPAKDMFPTYFVNRNNLWIYTTRYKPSKKVQVKGIIFLMHGFAEHQGRYAHVIKELRKTGYFIYAIDHQGHGRSHGDRGYVEDFNHYVDDAVFYFENIIYPRHKDDNLPFFVLGHSMGGLITLKTVDKIKDKLTGMILSAPALVPDPVLAHPFILFIGNLASSFLPKLELPTIGGRPQVSRDSQVQLIYYADPLAYTGGMRARWGMEMVHEMQQVMKKCPSVTIPFLLIQGTTDAFVDPKGATDFYTKAGSKDKTLITYDGYMHELMNEPEREHVLKDVINWLNIRSDEFVAKIGDNNATLSKMEANEATE